MVWVADNPEFLPPPRALLHDDRDVTAGVSSTTACPELPAPDKSISGTDFNKAIRHKEWKGELNKQIAKFLSDYFRARMRENQTLVIDSPGATESGCPVVISTDPSVTRRQKAGMLAERTFKGEADFAIWLHAKRCHENNVLVVARDTDVWMYGLALVEAGSIPGKAIYIERKRGQPVINLQKAYISIKSHPELQRCKEPVADMLFLYLQGGSDYVSKWYMIGHKTWMAQYQGNADFILAGTELGDRQELPSLISRHDTVPAVRVRRDAAMRHIACPFWTRCKESIIHSTGENTISTRITTRRGVVVYAKKMLGGGGGLQQPTYR